MGELASVDVNELVHLCAVDDQLYCKTFFPRTFRQEFPAFDDQVSTLLHAPEHRYVALKMFRGSAKTTRLRAFVSKRIAYAISNTIVFGSNAQKHAGFSLKWIRKQVEFNLRWAHTFGLMKGETWNDEHVEIIHRVDGRRVNLLALGITGQVRGINIEDYRPDLIVLDDPDNEETTRTEDQREKTSDLIFGALQKSLAPETENPTAKMVLLQTPFNRFDTISTVSGDNPELPEKPESWHVVTISCFGEDGESTWPARYPTNTLLKEKAEHRRLRKMSLWMREMECKIVASETASFDLEWLKYWDDTGLPPGMTKYIAIDPASSESKTADDQVIGVVGFRGQDIYVVEYTAEKGEMPEQAAVTFIGYLCSHVIHRAAVETIGYQRVLAWFIKKAMTAARRWCVVEEIQDRRKKSDRIIQALRNNAANGHLYVSRKHSKFIEQFGEYRPGVEMKDDVLDMVAMAITAHRGYRLDGEDEVQVLDESNIPELRLELAHAAP